MARLDYSLGLKNQEGGWLKRLGGLIRKERLFFLKMGLKRLNFLF